MAVNKDDTFDDIQMDEDEIEKALCVLAGSDPERCSYSQVKWKTAQQSCTHLPQIYFLKQLHALSLHVAHIPNQC